MKLILIFSLSQYLQNIIISTCNPHKNHNEMFNIFSTKYRKFSVYFVLPAHLNLWDSHFKHSHNHRSRWLWLLPLECSSCHGKW